ncbi:MULTISPECIES: DegT/DnrJ/EryC1/StrS family aminotransferase [unclassified Olleya]|jgi:dTDP-4-amino-4,6-dideoxygalactose transaminase|uniref:DegT/DnrJ/EryC1/StrS family aminotransferase n=1 Tax=unclassified Olleya TaxID=2615019 RepID=UPI0011A2A514|nr:DegT/DnrJ/EryC1/StrS family aminotransferase [Olleya sp. Hel_I_94]TVZ48086.1 dTDP-4-amino-4,6-dideoxygalactose transaminase [Olleya sp. Hel_I_94]
MNSKIWLSSPHMGGTEQNYIKEAFDTNWVAPLGPNVNGFEKDLETYLGQDKKVACLSSGTAAIHLALVQLGVVLNDEVICQTFTFCGSSNPIVYQGAIPVFVDSEAETWNMCPKHLEEAIKDRIANGKKPKAIIIVHLYGMPSKVDQLLAVAKKYQIPVVEDAAEALGSTYKGRQCGTFGDFSILSFNGNKIITTSGGGAMVCNTSEDKDQTIFYATQARDNAPHYEHSKIGYNYRMSNISAGIGRGQMEVLDKHIGLRRDMNAFYTNLFKDVKGVEVQKQPNEDFYSNFWLSCILIHEDAPFTKAQFQEAMDTENIETRPLWKPMHMQPIFKNALYFGDQLSKTLFEKGLCLPSGSNLQQVDLDRIKKVVNKLL